MKKITLVGPESSGKSTLCDALATYYHEPYAGEFARGYLTGLDRPYAELDLLRIADGQCGMEDDVALKADRFCICDTDMVTIRIWSEEVFGRCADELIRRSEERHYDLWFLCKPDIPWEPDPLRENPHDRDRLFTVYRNTLRRLRKPFIILEGSRDERVRKATEAMDECLLDVG